MSRRCRRKREQNLSNDMKNRFTVFVSSAVLITAAFLLSGCTASYDPDPDDYIRLGQYKGLKVEKATYEVSEEEMQDELDMLVNAYAKEDGTVPELTDDFIREISGGSIKDLDAYREALKEQMKSEYDEFYELQYYEDLWNMAVDNAEVIKDFPEAYLQKKTERSVIAAQKYAKSLDMTFSDFVDQKMGLTVDEFNKQAIDYAKVAAKESMVLQAIARAENITVSDEDIEKAIREYVEMGAFESEEAFRNEGPERMEELKEYILTSKVQDFLAENAAK